MCPRNYQYRRERDGAVAATESAYEASHLLQGQLILVTRERDLAQSKVCVLVEGIGIHSLNVIGPVKSLWGKTFAIQ